MPAPMRHVPGEDQPGGGVAFGNKGKALPNAEAKRYWDGVASLRQAESLLSLAGAVSGPADAPPASENTTLVFLDDWVARGKRALQRAFDLASGGIVGKSKEVGKRAAKHLYAGAQALMQTAEGAAHKGLAAFAKAASWTAALVVGTQVGIAALVALGLYLYFSKR